MRAFVFASAISLAAGASAAPSRVASLNLCADELVLAIAAPEQVASVTHLARDPHETPYWRRARRHDANDGSVVSVAGLRPDLIVTMGGLGHDRARLARRIGAELIDLPYPQSLDDVERSIVRIAAALDRAERGRRLIRAIRRLREHRPPHRVEGLFVSGSGITFGEGSLGAQWLALAGVRQPAGLGGRIRAERLLTDPVPLVVRSDYRAGQTSRGNAWPGFRLIAQAEGTRTVTTDGRRWTCMGPALVPEIERLRREIGG